MIEQKCLLIAKVVLQPNGRNIPVCVCNPLSEPVTLYVGAHLGILAPAQTIQMVKHREASVNKTYLIQSENSDSNHLIPDYLQYIYERSITNLPIQEHHLVTELLSKNSDVFANSDTDLGQTNAIQHDIKTGNAVPIKQPPRRFPKVQEQEIQKKTMIVW